MSEWSGLRAKWTAERDKHVKKGAVSGVSIGDAIEGVVKAQSKGYTTLNNAMDRLETAVGKYKAKLGKDKPDLIKWMEKNILGEVKEYRSLVALDIENLRWITNNLLARSDINILHILPDDGILKNVTALMGTPKSLSFAEAVAETKMWKDVPGMAALLAKRAATCKAMKWSAKLKGKDADYAQMIAMADTVVDDVKLSLQWAKATSLGDWADFLKAFKQKNTAFDELAPCQKSMKSLLA